MSPALPACSYPAMRARWCRDALRAFLRRWAVHAVVVAAAVGGGTVGAAGIIGGAAAWLVWPLFAAAAHPAWLLPAIAVHACAGALLLRGLRPLLWPAAWREIEAALPIPRSLKLRSDATVSAVALLPWAAACSAGSAALAPHQPPVGLAAVATALVGALLLGIADLQRARRLPWAPRRLRPAGATARAPVAAAGWRRVLLWWPLWRGIAPSSGRLLAGSTLALLAPSVAIGLAPRGATWALVAYAAGGLVVSSRLARLARRELQPLHEAAASLPLAATRWRRGLVLLSLGPLLPGGVAAAAWLPALPTRPGVAAAFFVTLAAVCTLEAATTPDDPAARSSRWLFGLVLLVVLAAEVIR